MIFHNYQGFEKHLKETPNDQLSSFYAIITESFEERSLLTKKIYKRFSLFKSDLSLEKVDFSKEAQNILAACEYSLFSRSKFLCIKNIEKISEKDLKLLSILFKNKDPIVFSARLSTSLKELYNKHKKELVVIDLTTEKPWERRERFLTWSLSYLKRFNLSVDREGLNRLLQNVSHFDVLKNELDKLVLYCNGEKIISKEIMQEVSRTLPHMTLWKVSEELFFSQDKIEVKKFMQGIVESTDIQTLFSHFKYHVELALYLKSCSVRELPKTYGALHAKTLERYKNYLKYWSLDHLKKTFQVILRYESLSRKVLINPKILLIRFFADVTRFKMT